MINPQTPLLALVVPCYNEQEIIATTVFALDQLLKKQIEAKLIDEKSFILFVDDGSGDNTLSIIRGHKTTRIKALKLANNAGHQSALLAGLHYVTNKVDCCISLDADLQDDIDVIGEMVENFKKGSQIVYGVRDDRTTDAAYKRGTAELFYRVMIRMGVPLVNNHADFRLVSNQVLLELRHYREVNLFLRGIFPLMGYPSSKVFYTRKKREAGTSKYPFWKMTRLALNGITSFTNYPLKIITALGTLIFAASLLAAGWVLWVVLTQ